MKGASISAALTAFAHGIAPDYTSPLAEIMAPQCVAPAAAGSYIAFDDDESFRYVNTRRALGGKPVRIELPATAPTFDCKPHALEIPTDDFELEKVGEAGVGTLREAKVRTLVSRSAISREYRVFQAYADGTTAESGLGTWTNAAKDPIDEINTIVIGVALATGSSNVHLTIALNALQQLGKHPKVLARFPGAQIVNVTGDILAKMLLIPVTVHVAMMPIATEKTGKTATKGIIGSAKVYAFITQANPSPYDPSAAKTFTTRYGQVDSVGFYEEKPFAEINYMSWSEDVKLTGTQCVKRIDAAIGDIA
jgi:hypothetical protein